MPVDARLDRDLDVRYETVMLGDMLAATLGASLRLVIRTLRAATNPATEDRVVPLSPKMVGLRFQAAARAAGVERVTAHSGRVGLAAELTSRGASTTDVMLAGNWKTSRGAVARFL